MKKTVLAVALIMACAGPAAPTRQAAETATAIRKAREGGAERIGVSAYYLQLATQGQDQARALLLGGDEDEQRRARSLLIRAHLDADLAHTLAAKFQAQANARHAEQRLRNRDAIARIKAQRAPAARAREAMPTTRKAMPTKVAQELNAGLEAEQRAQRAEILANLAIADLAPVATIKKEDRGMVISLAQSALFAGRGSQLLPEARQRLDQIADVLRDQDDKHFAIEIRGGAVDQAGPRKARELRRARAVRDHLIARGVSRDSVEARGVSPEQPVADNGAATGGASNRRIEIVVEKKAIVGDRGEAPHSGGVHEKVVVDALGSRPR